MSNDKVEAVHPLCLKVFHPICSWAEWLDCWKNATSFEAMLGLLHTGFNVRIGEAEYGKPVYDSVDRVIFYLGIANGWLNYDALRAVEDKDIKYHVGSDNNGNRIEKSPNELRKELATKAFDVLCSAFFKQELHADYGDGKVFDSIWETVTGEKLFPVIQNFFRIEEEVSWRGMILRNLPNPAKPHQKVAEEFLLNLARYILGWKRYEIPSYVNDKEKERMSKLSAEIQSRLDAAKPWMIHMLVGFKRLDLLEKWLLGLDGQCLSVLKKLAMSNKFERSKNPVIEDRRVANIDESLYLGSPAAWLLKKRELMKQVDAKLREDLKHEQERRDLREKEQARLKEIEKAKRVRQEADEKLKKLAPEAK